MDQLARKGTIRDILGFILAVTAIAMLAPSLGGSPAKPGLGFFLWGAAPLLTALAMRTLARDWADAGFRPGFRGNARRYSLAVIAVPAVMVANLALGRALSATAVQGFSLGPYLGTVLPAFGAFLVFAVFEEFGWRGYLVPKFQSLGMNDFASYAVIAVVWAVWHLPYIGELTWTYGGAEAPLVFFPRFLASILAYSILLYELRASSGSVWPCVLFHGLTNAIQHPMAGYMTIVPGSEYLASLNGLFASALIALLGLALRRGRIRAQRAPRP
jgi:uncharacterized protein